MCGVGEPGELLLSGPRLGRGYRGRPDLTADKFVPNPFYDTTADLPPEIRLHYQKVYHTGELRGAALGWCISLVVSVLVRPGGSSCRAERPGRLLLAAHHPSPAPGNSLQATWCAGVPMASLSSWDALIAR